MRLNYNDMLLLAIWEYNRRQDEDLTLELFQETFGQVPGAHFHDKWVGALLQQEPADDGRLFQG